MKNSLLLLLLIAATPVFADDARHLELARTFDALSGSKDKTALAAALVPEFARTDPTLQPYQAQLREFLVSIMESEEYLTGKAQAYMTLFSEAELEQLIALVQSPAYGLLQRKRNQMSVLLIRNMMELAARRLPEFRESLPK